MPDSRTDTLKAFLKPKIVKWGGGLAAVLGVWDALSSQFGLPTLREVFGMSGALLPWWGWLLILQAIFIYALFEYVRANVSDLRATPSPSAAEAATERKKLTIKVEKLEIELKEARETIHDNAKEATQTANRLELMSKLTNDMSEQTGKFFTLLQEQDTDLRNEIRAFQHGEKEISKQLSELTRRVQESFAALQQREFLALFESKILECSATLYEGLAAGETYNDEQWKEWERTHEQWRSFLGRWIDNARFYYAQLETEILRTEDSQYKGEWTVSDSQFPSAEAVRSFKQYRIQQSQWRERRDAVDANIKRVAFVGMTQNEVRNYG